MNIRENQIDNHKIRVTDPNLLDVLEPGQLKVIKRDGRVVKFQHNLIETAIKNAFVEVEGDNAQSSERIHKLAKEITENIQERLQKRWPDGGMVHIEAIQDQVENNLMRTNEFEVAKAYILYRERRRKEREDTAKQKIKQEDVSTTINLTLANGGRKQLDEAWLTKLVNDACQGLTDVDPSPIIKDTRDNLFDGVALKDVYKALVMSARTLVETEPNYSYVTARLLLQDLYNETLDTLGIQHNIGEQTIEKLYPICFKEAIRQGIEHELLHPNLKDFDLDQLAAALNSKRDSKFTYLSLQTLYDRYFLHHQERRIELPQVFFMRVAMGLAHCEGDARNERAIEFYNLLSEFDYLSSTPTLFNAGTLRPQLSSCFLTTVPDDLQGIYGALRDNAMLSKFAGGLGNDWTPVRAMGAYIKGTNGKSLGVVPFLNVADATAVAVNQGGKRKGAVCAYLETWHMDIEEFLDLRKNTGDERRRTHDMNTANWIPDLFMKRVFENKDWSLFSPDEVPDLHDIYGDAFEKAYTAYETQAEKGEIRSRRIPAVTLWRKILGMLFETG
ncbi:MAG: ribonucleoside-diphosphate reductase subunit alpha, partial [Gammaproteobacteria bacterium]|nr:ribonucleoside-diphosphate reductase subunit alpha [Gammaproteobacteria bacterium]